MRPPRPLALLLVAVAALGFTWAIFTPPWQAPDEPAHYGYVESLAQRHAFPGSDPGQVYSSAQEVSLKESNGEELSKLSDGRPQWATDLGGRLEAAPGASRTDDGGGTAEGRANTARSNPPAFYALEIVPYAVGGAIGGTPERLYTMRLAGVLLLLVTVSGAWLLIGELLGRRRILQLAGAGTVGLLPMVTFISSSVTPDALLLATWSLVLWLGVRVLNRGLGLRDGVALALLTALSVLTKGTSYALVPAVVLCLGVGWWRARPAQRRPTAALAAGLVTLALPVLLWVLASRSSGRPSINQVGGTGTGSALTDQGLNLAQMASYLWQFYLPRLPSQYDFPTVKGIPVYDVWLKDVVGRFGWLQIEEPSWLYVVCAIAVVLLVVTGVVALVRSQRGSGWAVGGFLALAAVALVAGLHLVDYRVGVQQSEPFMQGRYLLPLAALMAALVAGAVSLVAPRRQAAVTAVLLGCVVALQLVSLGRAVGFWYV